LTALLPRALEIVKPGSLDEARHLVHQMVWLHDDFDAARKAGERALQIARACPDLDTQIWCHTRLCRLAHNHLRRDMVLEHGSAALRLSGQNGGSLQQIAALLFMARTLLRFGESGGAETAHIRAADLAARARDRRLHGFANWSMSACSCLLGDWDRVRALYRESHGFCCPSAADLKGNGANIISVSVLIADLQTG
jgi:hypothetical protein